MADGNGYVDFGQEDWDEEAYSGDEDGPASKRAKAAQGGKARGVFNNLAPRKKKATERVSNVFLGGGERIGGAAKPKVQPCPSSPSRSYESQPSADVRV